MLVRALAKARSLHYILIATGLRHTSTREKKAASQKEHSSCCSRRQNSPATCAAFHRALTDSFSGSGEPNRRACPELQSCL